jgi:hypothetical protein
VDHTSLPDGGTQGTELACGSGFSGSSAVATTGPLDGGTVYVWFDSYNGETGPGQLTVTVP